LALTDVSPRRNGLSAIWLKTCRRSDEAQALAAVPYLPAIWHCRWAFDPEPVPWRAA